MKNHNLSKFVLRIATALVVLTLSAVFLVSLSSPVWAAGGPKGLAVVENQKSIKHFVTLPDGTEVTICSACEALAVKMEKLKFKYSDLVEDVVIEEDEAKNNALLDKMNKLAEKMVKAYQGLVNCYNDHCKKKEVKQKKDKTDVGLGGYGGGTGTDDVAQGRGKVGDSPHRIRNQIVTGSGQGERPHFSDQCIESAFESYMNSVCDELPSNTDLQLKLDKLTSKMNGLVDVFARFQKRKNLSAAEFVKKKWAKLNDQRIKQMNEIKKNEEYYANCRKDAIQKATELCKKEAVAKGVLALDDGRTVTATASRSIDDEVNLGGEGEVIIDEKVNLGGEGGLLALNDGRTVTATASRAKNEDIDLGGEGEVIIDDSAGGKGPNDIIPGGEGGLLALNDGKTVTATASRAKNEDIDLGGEGEVIIDDSAGGKGPNDIIPGGEGGLLVLNDGKTVTATASRSIDEDVNLGGEGNVTFGGGDVDIFDDDGTGDFDDDSEWSNPEDKIKPPPDDLIDITKDLSGGGDLTDDGFPCPKPPADYPINVGSKMKVGTGIGKMAGGLAKGLLGGLGGGFGGGGRGGGDNFKSKDGPSTSRDPIKKKHKTKFTDADTGTKIRVGAIATDDGLLLFSTHIDKAPGKGTFQTVFLEDNEGRRMLPVRYYVYKIWVKITLTVSWTRSTYVDGQLVKRETGGWSESWTKDLGTFVHRELGEMPVEGQPIWRQMGYGRATQGVRCLGTEFPITVDQLKETGPVSFVVHITRPKQNPVTTVPFIIQASVNADGDIELTQIEQTPATARCK